MGRVSLFLILTLIPMAGGASSDDATVLGPVEFFELRGQARAHMEAGEWPEAVPLLERLHRAAPDDGQIRSWLGSSLFRSDREQEALLHGIAAWEQGFGPASLIPWVAARIHLESGETEQALAWLERALAAPLESRPDLQTADAFASLRDDPRFRRIAGFLPEGIDDRGGGWRHDLDFLLEETRRMHGAPARPAHSEEFAGAVAALKARVPELSDTAVAAEVQRLMAMLGDGHSVLYPFPTEVVSFTYLPVGLYFFSDGLFVVDAQGGAPADLVGGRVVAIGGKSTETLLDDLRPFVSRDNDQGLRWIGPRYLTVIPLLVAMGYGDAEDSVRLTIEDAAGSRRDVVVAAGPPAHGDGLRSPASLEPPLWLARADAAYWHQSLPELRALYVQFNQVADQRDGPSIADYSATLREELEKSRFPNVILDLRHNNGGNNHLIWPLVRALLMHEQAGDDHRVWVITGRGTFSACQNLINHLERVLEEPIFVGEVSSSKPNATGESTNVLLPYSGLKLSIASRYWQDSAPGDRRPYIPVSMPVELSSADFFGGRDPVMEALAEVLAD